MHGCTIETIKCMVEPSRRAAEGFANGFLVFMPDTEIVYNVSALLFACALLSLRHNDSAICITWPVAREQVDPAQEDAETPRLADVDTAFTSGGSRRLLENEQSSTMILPPVRQAGRFYLPAFLG
jgi:hypothetical protein